MRPAGEDADGRGKYGVPPLVRTRGHVAEVPSHSEAFTERGTGVRTDGIAGLVEFDRGQVR